MQMVKDCGVQEVTPLMHTATFLIVKPEFREAFSTLMDPNISDVAKEAQKGLQLLAELSQHAAILGEMGNQYTERYLQKGKYRQTPETGLQWVMRCLGLP
ncbi:hypothetical protein EJB05_49946, partial [Eragrostis curvula]